MLAHLVHVRAADAILHRPADRRPELERGDPRDRGREILGQHLLELGLQPLARVDVLGDDHRLGEEVVRQLDVERQVEADRAPADIGAPALDVVDRFASIASSCSAVGLAGVDRGVVRQRQIDHQLGPVGGREELLRHEAHGEQRHDERARS